MQIGTVRPLYLICLNYVKKNYEKFKHNFNLIPKDIIDDIDEHYIFKKNIVLMPKGQYPTELSYYSYLLSSEDADDGLSVGINDKSLMYILHIYSGKIVITNTGYLKYKYHNTIGTYIKLEYRIKLVINNYLHNYILHITEDDIYIKFSKEVPEFSAGDIIKDFSYVYYIYKVRKNRN